MSIKDQDHNSVALGVTLLKWMSIMDQDHDSAVLDVR